MSLGASYYPTIRREPFVVGYWRLNEAPGSAQAIDYGAKFGLIGIYSAISSPGQPLIQSDLSAASYLSASSNFVSVGDIAPLQITTDISVEAWVLPTVVSQTATLIAKANNAGTVAMPYRLSLTTGQLKWSQGNGLTASSIIGGTPLLSIPSHVVATSFRGAMKLYLNGQIVASGSVGSHVVTDGGNPLYFGSIAGGTPFSGYIGEVAVYNSALSTRRVARHFTIGQQILSDPAHYRLIDHPVYSSIVVQNTKTGRIPTNLTAPVIFDGS